jgi:hypothetical protein
MAAIVKQSSQQLSTLKSFGSSLAAFRTKRVTKRKRTRGLAQADHIPYARPEPLPALLVLAFG